MDVTQVLVGLGSGILMGIPLGVNYCSELRQFGKTLYRLIKGEARAKHSAD